MAKAKKQRIQCPKCGKEIEIEVWDKLEMPYDEDQKEKIMKNIFFRMKCEACGIQLPMLYDCEYNDLEKKFLIWIVPKFLDSEKVRIMKFNKRLETDKTLQLAQGGYRYRLVRSDNELREKVLIFEEGLDDRFIETMKITYVPLIRKNIGNDCNIRGIYFDRNGTGAYQWVVILEKREPLVLDVNMDIYEDMKEKLWDTAEKKTIKGLALIEERWALDVMETYARKNRETAPSEAETPDA